VKFIGLESSSIFVHAPEVNRCAQRFIQTLKEKLVWVRSFDMIEALWKALLEFQRTYNETWLIEQHCHRPPAACIR
jgi:putative transposase